MPDSASPLAAVLSPVPPEPIPDALVPDTLMTPHRHSRHTAGLTLPLLATTIVACLGLLQYGYHMAELNAPEAVLSCQASKLPARLADTPYSHTFYGRHGLAQCVPMEAALVGTITLAFPLGGLLGSTQAGVVADRLGRRRTIMANGLLYTLGLVLATCAGLVAQLVWGRVLLGVAAGGLVVVTALFIAEVAPLELRGLLGSMNQVSINVGILLTQVVAIRFANDFQWRHLLLLGAVIGLTNILAGALIAESPVWLVHRGRRAEAGAVLAALRGTTTEDVAPELDALGWEQDAGEPLSRATRTVLLRQYLTDSTYRPSLSIATAVMTGQQFCGVNSIIFYGVLVITQLLPQYAIAVNCLVLLVNVCVTFFAGTVLDLYGRKPLLVGLVLVMGVGAFAMGLGIVGHHAALVVVAVFVYIASFAMGLGPIPFLLILEVTQPEAKLVAQLWGTSINWVATFAVGYLFPILSRWWGGYVYFLFTAVSGVLTAWLVRHLPETKGRRDYNDVWSRFGQLQL